MREEYERAREFVRARSLRDANVYAKDVRDRHLVVAEIGPDREFYGPYGSRAEAEAALAEVRERFADQRADVVIGRDEVPSSP